MYSKEWEDARISDCLANGTVDPTPMFDGRSWSTVIVDTPAVGVVALFIVKYKGLRFAVAKAVVSPLIGGSIVTVTVSVSLY